eukprot:TRINITY_DN610_c1_g1_i2.p1 TRINITY_DN610_c1_g1~~TRINITY_DN610_c1_g1_i2.p1  ORF type:complete len:409 (+),score=38.52 TRINITY_DN610_c1_g1_i2:491-1717(+)
MKITLSELRDHNTRSSYWVSIDHKIYDLTDFLSTHPGGESLPMQVAGQDGSALFYATHSLRTREILFSKGFRARYYVGDLERKQDDDDFEFDDDLYREICCEVEASVPGVREKRLRDILEAVMICLVFLLVQTIVILSGNVLWFGMYPFVACLVAFIVMHGNNHGGITRQRGLYYFFDFVSNISSGVCGIGWRKLHNVEHHWETNNPEVDTDIDTMPYVRTNVRQDWYWFHRYQHIYTFFGMALSGFTLDVKYNLAAMKSSWLELDMVLLLISRVIRCVVLFLPMYFHGYNAFLGWIYVHLVGATIYTHVIAPNHINEYCQVFPQDSKSWALHQIRTSSTYAPGSALITHLTGGLNHQVEHHLFPAVHFSHYDSIHKILTNICERRGIKYNQINTFPNAIRSYYRFLN